ncbi:MAG: type II toxin-antitoxin system RelE/ParE family toxin [Oscillospiraceae bacterium]|nr:type II toxin-antitoxin system RelE/ParE family toxin [Oscillospiraceae bacterium]
METDESTYEIEFTEEYDKELDKIYNYISKNLCAEDSAKKLLIKTEQKIINLKYSPKIYVEIKKYEGTKRRYRRLVVDNYVILYTIDEEKKIVYVVHIFYGGSDYINKI